MPIAKSPVFSFFLRFNDPNKAHPRFSQHKTSRAKESGGQEGRRLKHLERQRARRQNYANWARDLVTGLLDFNEHQRQPDDQDDDNDDAAFEEVVEEMDQDQTNDGKVKGQIQIKKTKTVLHPFNTNRKVKNDINCLIFFCVKFIMAV